MAGWLVGWSEARLHRRHARSDSIGPSVYPSIRLRTIRPSDLPTIRLTILLLAAPQLVYSQPRPIQLEDFYRFQAVSAPAISPDGRRVAFVRTVVVEAENRRRSEIWIVPSDGSAPPIRLTSPALDASGPTWSHDGRLLGFRARGKTGEEIRFVDPNGRRAPFRIEGVGGRPRFSPDDRWIGFTRAVRPAFRPGAPRTELERKLASRFTGRTHEWVQYRFDGRGYLPDPTDPAATPPAELFVVPRSGGVARQLTRLGVDVDEAAWSPDSKRILLVADAHQRDEYTYERADLWVVDLEGTVRRLTDDGYHHDGAVWSPDGRSIAFRRQKGLSLVIAGREARGPPIDLYLMSAEGGEMRNLTDRWDLIPEDPRFGADGNHLYFTAEIGGDRHLFRVGVSSGAVEQLTRGARQLSEPTFSGDFSRMAFVVTDPTRPSEVFATDRTGREVQLSRFNDSILESLVLARPTPLRYSSKDGTPIEGWFLPPGNSSPSGDRYPLVVVIHGGPHGAYGNVFSIPFQLLSAAGYAVLYTNPRGSTGYGEDFLWATWGAWGNLDSEDVLAGVDHVVSNYPIDPSRLGVSGYSYGGFLTNWIITHDRRFVAAISGAGISNWVSDYATADIPRTKESEFFGPPWEREGAERLISQSPVMHAKGVTTPTLFIQGEADYRVPVEQGEQMYLALRKQRVPARMVRYPDMAHGGWTPWNTVHRMHEELQWWRRWLR